MIAPDRTALPELNFSASSYRSSPHVLVVEDDGLVCAALQETLEFGGCRTRGARNGREAMEMLRKESFDAVVTDIVMPHADGLELIMHLRRHHPSLAVVAISGDSDADPEVYLRIARHLGVGATLVKPFGAVELLETLADAFAQLQPPESHSGVS